ncbi:MAG TPA: hypothetical protein VGS07_12905 [Thermoanaerobaculia bacterium]|jgi:hypothetical protein|nr:hypothetical protein [Thermoanaerobaculia bacterium]
MRFFLSLVGRRRAVQDLYEYLAGQKEGGLTKDVERFWYSLNEYHPRVEQQSIRSPRRIFDERCGTCLDLTALFAGLCLSQRLCPLVVVTKEHAFALVALMRGVEDKLWDVENLFAKGPVTDTSELLFLLDEGDESGDQPEYLPVECTGFAGRRETGAPPRGPLTFKEAVEEGRKALEKALKEQDLRFVLDVTSARYLLHEPGPDREFEPLWEKLAETWLDREAETIGALSGPQDLRLNEVDGPVPFWFQKLLAEKPWHEKIGDLLDGIAGPPITKPEVQQLQERLKIVNLSAGYGTLLRELQTVLTRSPGTRAFWQRFSEMENKRSRPSADPPRTAR